MKLLDLTAIDRLIDFNSEESLVRFFEDDKVYTLEEFRDLYNENNWNLSIGVDHMKYVMVAQQHATIDGYIDLDDSLSEDSEELSSELLPSGLLL